MSHRCRVRSAILLSILIAACGGEEPPPAEERDTTTGVVPLPMQQQRGKEFDPENVANFEELVFSEYARSALPTKSASDSILAGIRNLDPAILTDPAKIEEELNRRGTQQRAVALRRDTVARRQLAAKYGITLDSLNAILDRKQREKQEKQER